jgi:hypothetical protein
MIWRIYYSSGDTFDSNQGKPEDAPSFGIICIVAINDLVGRSILHRRDWYWWESDEETWSGGDIYGLLDRLLHRLPTEAIGQGRTVPTKAFSDIMGQADKDPDFP